MSKAEELEAKWVKGVETDTLDPGDIFGDTISYCHSLEESLSEAVIGLEWEQENRPEQFSKADNEKLVKWKKLLGNER